MSTQASTTPRILRCDREWPGSGDGLEPNGDVYPFGRVRAGLARGSDGGRHANHLGRHFWQTRPQTPPIEPSIDACTRGQTTAISHK